MKQSIQHTKWISVVLTLCMVLSGQPVTAVASNVTGGETLEPVLLEVDATSGAALLDGDTTVTFASGTVPMDEPLLAAIKPGPIPVVELETSTVIVDVPWLKTIDGTKLDLKVTYNDLQITGIGFVDEEGNDVPDPGADLRYQTFRASWELINNNRTVRIFPILTDGNRARFPEFWYTPYPDEDGDGIDDVLDPPH